MVCVFHGPMCAMVSWTAWTCQMNPRSHVVSFHFLLLNSYRCAQSLRFYWIRDAMSYFSLPILKQGSLAVSFFSPYSPQTQGKSQQFTILWKYFNPELMVYKVLWVNRNSHTCFEITAEENVLNCDFEAEYRCGYQQFLYLLSLEWKRTQGLDALEGQGVAPFYDSDGSALGTSYR